MLLGANPSLSPVVTFMALQFTLMARDCFDALQNWSNEHAYVKVILAGRAASSVCSWTGCGVKKLQTLFVSTLDTARPNYLCCDLHGVASRIVLLWAPRILAARAFSKRQLLATSGL